MKRRQLSTRQQITKPRCVFSLEVTAFYHQMANSNRSRVGQWNAYRCLHADLTQRYSTFIDTQEVDMIFELV